MDSAQRQSAFLRGRQSASRKGRQSASRKGSLPCTSKASKQSASQRQTAFDCLVLVKEANRVPQRQTAFARGTLSAFARETQFACFTSTKVQMLTQQHVRRQLTWTTRRTSRLASGSVRSLTRYSLYLLHWYKSANTDTALADEVLSLLALLVQKGKY